MLIKNVVKEYGDRVRYVDHNYGDSKLAERFGVEQYPAVFVDEALVARPQDFHLWDDTEEGRYTPWKDAASHARFQEDLRRMIDVRLRGGELESLEVSPGEGFEVERLPAFSVLTVDGAELDSASLAGKLVVVEVWATWCPPCRSTLGWLGDVARRYGDDLAVVAVAVASKEEDVKKAVEEEKLAFPVVMGTDELTSKFGNVVAVPTLFLFDRQGRTAATFYGAPPDLHEKVGERLESLK